MKLLRLVIFSTAAAAGAYLFVAHRAAPEGGARPAAVSEKTAAVVENSPPPVLTPPVAEVAAAPVPADFSPAENLLASDPKPLPPAARVAPAAPAKSAPSAAPAPTAAKGKKPLQDPVARAALYFVGADPQANEYWFSAINDPSLSKHERQDLIEDLNEDGLPDPKHPTADDLPLIVSRLQLLEMVGAEPMDEVNADAFAEAYKDLVNLASVAAGAGAPVK